MAETLEAVRIRVYGHAAPKGSRNVGKTKDGRTYTYPASRYEKPWVEAVKAETILVMRHHRQPEKPYHVGLTFYLRKPAKNRKEMPWWPTQHDLDKLARAVVDGLVFGGALADDRHVCELTVTKEYAETAADEGVTAEIRCIALPGHEE